MNNEIIEAQGLTKIYGNTVMAVNQISFSVKEGELFGFLGPNGAGKTTTIKMLTTLASITAGRATVAGYDVRKKPAEVRAIVGIVPQEFTADDELKGTENLLLAAKLHHVPNATAHERSKNLLKLVDLEGAAERRVKTYSGGMRRRLQLAMGLIHSPKILFLDEPTLGLDVQTRRNIWNYIEQLNRENGVTVFMTTHYLEEADSLCHRIAIIDGGIIKASGSPAELKEKLGGDVLTIELSDGPDMTSFFKTIRDVSEVTKIGSAYKIRLSRIEQDLPIIVEGATKKGLNITGIALARPSLDQVFLEITGNSMRDNERNGDSYAQRVMIERLK
ncbi:MAG: ATP-binding cassette domain-containing protein [Candidatus Bathyarchaeia archaeon]|jgi:ABC-2 type transport system ATP-binding protein